MKIRTKILLIILSVFLPTVLVGGISYWQLNKISKPISEDIPKQVSLISKSSRLNALASLIRYYDEVLTQSARNYAFTGDAKWKIRYYENAPKLDLAIKESLSLGDSEDKETFAQIDSSNIALVKMEEEAFGLVDSGNKDKAIDYLASDQYSIEKKKYKTPKKNQSNNNCSINNWLHKFFFINFGN